MKTYTELERTQHVALVFAQQLACAVMEWAHDQERTRQAHSPHCRAILPALRSFGEAMVDVKILEGRQNEADSTATGNHWANVSV